VTTRYDELMDGLRTAARPDRPAPSAFTAYLAKVHAHAYKVTDGDVSELKAAGFGEDEIFEQTVSVAVAAGLERLDAALAVLP
jgi:alkylhydroperoxidase family enzyme